MATKKRVGKKEAAYLAAEDATELWAFLRSETLFHRHPRRGRGGDGEYNHRLLYLMAAAVFRTVQKLVPSRRWRKLLDAVEDYADGKVTFDQLFEAYENGSANTDGVPAARSAAADCTHLLPDDYKVIEGVDYVTDAMGYLGAVAAGVLDKNASDGRAVWEEPSFQDAKRAHERALCVLIRDIFGNPFRPVAVAPEWLSPTAVALARGIYDEKAFDRLPILADALQDAGCEDDRLLGHCRGSGPHVRGCWAVDLVLGRGSTAGHTLHRI